MTGTVRTTRPTNRLPQPAVFRRSRVHRPTVLRSRQGWGFRRRMIENSLTLNFIYWMQKIHDVLMAMVVVMHTRRCWGDLGLLAVQLMAAKRKCLACWLGAGRCSSWHFANFTQWRVQMRNRALAWRCWPDPTTDRTRPERPAAWILARGEGEYKDISQIVALPRERE